MGLSLRPGDHTSRHRDLGPTSWYTVRGGEQSAQRAAWQHTELPAFARELQGRVAFAWRAIDAFYEEDERIVGHAADSYHRIDIRQATRHLVVRCGERVVADGTRPLVLYVGQIKRAAWSYVEAWPEVARVSGFVSFEPDMVDVHLDGRKLPPEPGQAVIPHGIDRGLDPDEVRERRVAADQSGHLPSSRRTASTTCRKI